MSSGVQPEAQGDESPAGGLAFGDILFTIFRHKVLISAFILLGLIAATVVRFVKPPNYESTAKIYVPYVVNLTAVNPQDADTTVTSTGVGGDMVMNTEVDMLKSFDTAIEVADKIGPEKILARYGGGSNRLAAAGVIAGGILVAPPRTMSLVVTYSHRDPDLVQPVMEVLLKVYMHRHRDLRLGVGGGEYFVEKTTEARKKLTEIEAQIKQLKIEAGVPDLRERQNAVSKEYAELQGQVLRAQTELAQLKAALGEISQNATNLQANPLPTETISTYSDVREQIEAFKRRRMTLLLDDLTTNHPSVLKLDVKIEEQVRLKLALEKEFPTLTNYISAVSRGGSSSNGVARLDLESELANISRIDRTIKSDLETLEKLKLEAFRLMEIEPKLTDLERQREGAFKDYDFFISSVKKSQLDDNSSGRMVNMEVMQSPTPPRLDKKKMLKLVGMALGGCIGLGFGLAFLMDMFLDRSIRRPTQVVRSLNLPVMLTIPDMNRKESSLFPWSQRNQNLKLMRPDKKQKDAEAANAVAPWSPDNQLQTHIEGLRERVITHFEVKNMDHHPKLVAVTACTEGAGVSTLASGLAASLSRTGSGSVLLVDLNAGEGVTHSFYKGKPGYGPSESIETESETDQEEPPLKGKNLSLTKLPAAQSKRDRLADMLPPGFNDQMPKLKADVYDYVVFDMTCISPASVTPRMSGHMDLVLFVIESEKTKEHTARHARGLMRESRANVVGILNKYYNPVPKWLAHD
jgi:succinoglycan biosynthesis transport protein ExoP